MRAIDTHAHLDFPTFDSDRPKVLQAISQADLGVINVATSQESVRVIDGLTKKTASVWGMVGLHPTDIGDKTLIELPTQIEYWGNLLKENPKFVGLGEVGLDYYHQEDNSTASVQKAALRMMLTFAQEQKLPVSFHCRDAYGDLTTLLAEYKGISGVVHCFSGTQEQAYQFLELGLHISFTAMIGYPGNDILRQVAVSIPNDRLLLETDSPFLPVQAKRGTRNDPTAVFDIAEELATIRQVTSQDILGMALDNTLKVFPRLVAE
ncbi:MAG TPA: TatD family hydrolase [Candidatus Saccharimonadales bacterium]|nr:TatD family hydrolase [Candidatus Saccharimonadales bacterium]